MGDFKRGLILVLMITGPLTFLGYKSRESGRAGGEFR
jgi:hypothetical protein